MNIDAARQRLLEGDPDAVLKELVDFYRRADVLHTPQLPRLLDALFPAWKALLHTRLPPQARATPTHRCRKVLLQILNRLPSNDALRPYVPQLLHLLLEVLYRDNEDNALLALKTVFELHRNYRPGLRSEVQAFLDLVQQMYKNVHVTVRKQFAEAVVTPPSSQAAASPTVSTVATTPTTTAAASAASTVETSGTTPPSVDGAVSTLSTASTTETTSDPAATTTTAEPVMPVKTESASAPLSIAAVSSESPAAAVDTKADGSAPPQPPSAAPGVAAATPSTPVPSIASSTVAVDEPLWSSMESFKAISELPLIIMLLFQCYPTFIESHVPVLVPLMMNLLSLRAPDSAPRQHPQRYVDFLDCQVKTLSFVTYLLRGCATLMRPFQDAICESTVKLLTVCPKDAFVLRKDIFVAARHIISTEFRRGFYAQLELLMDDDVLIGKGRCSFHQIRPLAYSTLADMIHHVRDMLTLSQVSHIVDFYGKRIHDATLPISIQTTSIRLLLNLVDISAKNDDADGWKGRTILSRILLIIASKFGSTLASLPVAIGLSLRSAADRGGAGAAPTADLLDAGAMDKIRQSTLLHKAVVEKAPHEKKLDALLAPYLNAVPRSASGSVDSFLADEEPCIRDVKSLLRTMILGVRAVIWCTANYRNPHAKDLTSMDANASHVSGSDISAALQGTATESSGGIASRPSSAGSTNADATSAAHAYPLTDDERKLISRVLQNGLRCFILYTLSENTLAEEKQMLDHFAGAFTVLDAPDFRDLFLANMELLYECILQDHAILTVPQHFLANSNVSCWFAEILLKFLITQMKDLSVAAEGDVPDMKREHKVLEMDSLRFERMRVVKQEHRASIVLRLFKIVFGSVTLFKSNESALFPHLRTIIESCLKEATFTKHPDNYLLLLRALFRSISGGKYENFYKEVFPLLPGILSALMRLQQHIQKPSMHEVLLELCLTIPARLSSLLQYLPSLMKSVVRAILSRGELAYLGLRTLEFWVDNLNPDFLYPIMTSQDRLLTEIIEALDTHLLPPPYPYGELSMRILGKIGGRNRQYQMDPLELAFESEPQRRALVMEFAWRGLDVNKKPVALGLHMDVLLRRAAAILHRYHRKAPHEWEHVVRKDARLSDSDEYDDHANTAGATAGGAVVEASLAASAGGGSASSSLLLEKDDKTLELERQAAANVKQTILQYKRYAFDVVASATTIAMQLSEAEEPDEDEDEENDEEEEEDDAMNGAETSTRPSVVWESELPTRQLLLKTLFETMDDIDFGEAATRLLMRTATQMTKKVSDVCDRHEPNFAALSTLQPSSLLPGNRGLSPGRHLATAKRIEVLRQASYGTPFVVVPHSRAAAFFQAFASAILGGLSSPNSQVVDGAKKVLERVVETALHHYEADIDAASAAYKGGALFLTLTDVFAHACFDKSSWRVKLGGVTGLRLLVDLLAAPFCHENELVIVKALFFVLSDHPSEVSATVSVETGEALLAVVDKARDVRGLDIEAFSSGAIKRGDFMSCTAFQETEIFQMFVVEFLSPKAAARRCARQCIARVAAFTGTTESAMLFPYQQLISKQITGCPLRSLSSATRIGYIDAMAHALSIQPTIFPLTKELMTFLQDVWRLISDDATPSATEAATTAAPGIAGGATSTSSNVPVSAQEYPFGLSQASELRIAAVKLFRAAFLAAPDDMNQHHEARNRFVGVFFRYLTRQPLELVTCAQQALSDVIQLNKQHKEITLPKELLQQCLRPVLLNLADYRKLNLPLLDGLSRLLTLLSSCFNVTLGEKLLEHLKQWRDPDRIMKAGIWKRGDEPAVAAAIVDLFHLLPPNESFLESLVDCVVELEAVLPQYGSYGKMSSPYRLPLTRFLNRYASTSIAFFLKRDKLIEPKYSSLFQELLKLPEALPLRNILLSETGAESLMAATFVAASKTSSLASAAATIESAAKTSATTATPTSMGVGMDAVVGASEDIKMQAQIQLNAHKAAAQAVANAQAQGLSPSAAEARGMQARAAYVAKATAQVNAQQALKVQSQVQIQANAQKLHAQTLAAAQAQGLSLVQAQAKAQFASKDYIAKAQSQVAASTALPSPISSSAVTPSLANTASPHHVTQLQAQQLHAQIQVNAQKVHAQALAAAHAQGLKPIQAQEKAKQAQATYVHRAKAQAQAKIARAAQTSSLSSALPTTPSALSTVAPFTSKAQQEALELLYQGLRLVRTISKLHATWLATPHAAVLVDCLRKLWRSPSRVQRLLAQERLQIRFHYESKLLVKILVTYCRAKPDDVQVLLDLLSAFVHRSSSFDNSVLQLFYQQHVAHAYSPYNKRQIVRLFLRMLRDSATPDELKVHAMQVLIMPVLTTSFDDPTVNNTDMLDADIVQWMLREILASKDTPTGSLPPSDAVLTLRIELLKLGTLLIQHMSKYVTEHRKEVIKFAWNHLKAHDLTSKLWAYVNVCRFISVYDTPPKIVLQVYVALLRTHEMDARFLVRKAFDILLPALPSRLPPNEFIKAIKWTKKIAYEEGHQLGQLVHIWFLIVRHPALFYPFRGQFVPLMVNSLNRLAIPPSSTPDNRRLAVNIVDLIIAWEHTRRERVASRPVTPAAAGDGAALKRRALQAAAGEEETKSESESPSQKRRKVMSGTSEDASAVAVAANGSVAASSPTAKTAAAAYSEDDFELNAPMIDLVLNFAFRFALASADKQETSRLSKTCGELFDKALRLWPSASVRFSYFDKLIAVTAEAILRQQPLPTPTPPTQSMPTFFAVPKGAPLSSLAILDAVLGILNALITPEVVSHSARPVPYVVQYAPRVMKLLEPCFDRANGDIQTGLTTFLRRMVELYPPGRAVSQELIACKFYPWLQEIVADRLQSAVALQQEFLTSLPSHAASSAVASGSSGGGATQKTKNKQGGGSTAAAATASGVSSPASVKSEPKAGQASPGTAAAAGSPAKRQKTAGSDPAVALKVKAALAAAQNARSSGIPPSVFAGETALRLLASLCDGAPAFADPFAPTLLKLAQFFTREHLLHAAASAAASVATTSPNTANRIGGGGVAGGGAGGGAGGAALSQDTASLSDSMTRHRVMATPSLAITEEWQLMLTGRSTLSVNNVVRHLKKKEPGDKHKKKSSHGEKESAGFAAGTKAGSTASSSGVKKKGVAAQHASAANGNGTNTATSVSSSSSAAASGLLSHKMAVELLIVTLRLLSKCSLPSADHRRVYTNLLIHCLESSTNVPLLLEITRIAGAAITTAPPQTATTATPNLITAKDKMTLLTKMSSFERLHEVAARPLYDEYYRLVLKLCDPSSDVKHSYFHITPSLPQSHSLTTHFVAGLLAPDAEIREQFLKYLYEAAASGSPDAAEDSLPTARLLLVLRQDWQACGSRYWIAVAVETMLSAATNSTPTGSPRANSKRRLSGQLSPTSPSPSSQLDLLRALRYLAHVDVEIAEELWIQLFRETWQQLSTPQQAHVSSQLVKTFSSKFNKRDLYVPLLHSSPPRGRVNVVQTLLRSLVAVTPTAPVLTPELVLHLAGAYDAWSSAMRLCEFQVENASLRVESRLRWIEALSSIYKTLSDDDLRVGLSLEHIAQPETRAALVLESLGCVHEAQEEYFKALSKAQSGRVSMDDVNLFELRLWEERWVACAKQLCQWQLMHDFAKATQNQDLLLDCVWKRGDWHGAKQLLNVSMGATGSSSAAGSSTQAGAGAAVDLGGACPHTRLQRLYIAILDSEKRASIDTLAAQTAELALFQWQGLPRVLGKSHVALLHLFHQFVEVKESIQMMYDIKHASQLHTLPNLKPSINTWRERLPNKWEPILMWDDILTWRSHMFQVVKNTFSWSDAQMLACMHDSPWSVIRLAHTARKQHLPDVCLGALSKLYTIPAMDVQDAFSKLREQVSICYESASEYTGGLAILNNTNLDYFSLRQKAEMFRLKALFLEAMGNSTDANQTFSHCLQICDSYGKGWLSWGHYCYRLFVASSGRGGHGRELSFASQTIACYLQAIHHRCNAARLMIARVLWLLSMDDPHRGVLIQAFEAHGKQLPIWIWIVWIPQLLMALGRPEAPQIRGLLRGLSAKFPQALYYTMRAFFLENRDSSMAAQQQQMSGQGQVSGSAPTTPQSSGSTGAATTVTASTGGPGTPTFSGTPVYYRTKTGQVVAVPSTMPLNHVQQIPGLVAPARPTPSVFGVALSQVMTVDAWRERLLLGSGGADGASSQATSSSSSSSSAASSSMPTKPELGPVQYTEDLLNFLRRTHDSLTFEMECVLEEMITKFRPEPEEELLTAVHSLLLKCYQLPRLSQREPVPRMLRAALEKVCRKLFAVTAASTTTGSAVGAPPPPQQHKNEKYVEFVAEFKAAFEADFAPDASLLSAPIQEERVTLFEMMDRLKKWRNLLQARVQHQSCGYSTGRASTLRLEHCSRFLMELSSSNMEVPGQYIADREPIKDLHARIQHFDNDVDVLLRSGYTQRRLTMGGSDGATYSFLVQYAMTHTTRTDERMAQMYLLLNRLLARHKETRKRNAVFHVPRVVPLTPRVRLLEDSRDVVTLGEIYDQSCRASDTDPDLPMELYRQRISEAYAVMAMAAQHDASETISPQQEDEQLALAKARAFDEVCASHVPETLLAKYIFERSAHADAYFEFRSEFTKHLALSSLLAYVLFVGDRAPHRILFSRRTARVVSAELRPGYASSGLLEASTSMPFRLTRNLHNFVTRPGVHGPFSVVMAATAEALMGEEELLGNQLGLFFRDDLLSWHASKTRLAATASSAGMADSASQQQQQQRQRRLESQVQQRVDANVSLVLERIRGVSLKKETDSQRGKSVRELLEIATSPERQREMYPTWCPWL